VVRGKGKLKSFRKARNAVGGEESDRPYVGRPRNQYHQARYIPQKAWADEWRVRFVLMNTPGKRKGNGENRVPARVCFEEMNLHSGRDGGGEKLESSRRGKEGNFGDQEATTIPQKKPP